MEEQEGGAPSWLFSFVDLAFLMLIAMTQLAPDMTSEAPDLGEIIVPSIGAEAEPGPLRADASRAWQLRIYPPSAAGETPLGPFALILGGSDSSDEVVRGNLDFMRDEVAKVFRSGAKKPLLAPHEDSRSRDLLDAVALLEEHWPSHRRALVARLAEL